MVRYWQVRRRLSIRSPIKDGAEAGFVPDPISYFIARAGAQPGETVIGGLARFCLIPLPGFLGIASAGGWNYTAALARLPGEWTYEKLNTFLADPATAAPGTVMFYDGLPDPTERANAIAYLRTLSDSPLPLPK